MPSWLEGKRAKPKEGLREEVGKGKGRGPQSRHGCIKLGSILKKNEDWFKLENNNLSKQFMHLFLIACMIMSLRNLSGEKPNYYNLNPI